MSKILIVTDTTSSLTFEKAAELNIELVPLTIQIGEKVYTDQVDLTSEQLIEALRQGAVPTTSQPNIGLVEERMSEWKKENYDAIFIYSISSYLSGTFNGFNLVANQLEMDNVHVIDSKTMAGPLLDAALTARKMADEGASVDAILNMSEAKFSKTVSFIYPKTLEQLKRGGRISSVAASMSSLLKIKPVLILENQGKTIEKFGIARTDAKVYEMVTQEFMKSGAGAEHFEIYLAHAAEADALQKCIAFFTEKFPGMNIHIVPLPAVLLSHGGIGCIGIQLVYKG
ncbi:MAG: DegV family protein [Erysipelotrichaceae bacterium]